MRTSAVLACVLATLASIALGAPASMQPLPAPTGSAPVGTTTVYLADSGRRDADFPVARPVTMQLWYPAQANGKLAPYLIEPGLSRAIVDQSYYGIDSTSLAAWAVVRTHARLDAPPSQGQHPLVTFSVGLGFIR